MLINFSLSSCSKDEPDNIENYYVQLAIVETSGYNVDTKILKEEWIVDNNADSDAVIDFGRMTQKEAIARFEEYVEIANRGYNNIYTGENIIPRGGRLVYVYRLIPEDWLSDYGYIMSGMIEITNSGSTYFVN